MEDNIKEQLEVIRNATEARELLNTTLFDLVDKLNNIKDFISDLDELIREDKLHLCPYKEYRADMKYINDTVTILLNNLDSDSCIPTDTTGVKL